MYRWPRDSQQGIQMKKITGSKRFGVFLSVGLVCVAVASCGGGESEDSRAVASESEEKAAQPLSASKLTGLRWSDPNTWRGTVPKAGADVVIPAGLTIVLDVSPPPLGRLEILGTLQFDNKDIQLTAASMEVDAGGVLQIGAPSAPYMNKAILTLNGAPEAVNNGVSRGLNVKNGGTLALYGNAPFPAWTKINDHVAAGAKSMTLANGVNWKPGSTLALAPTDFYKSDHEIMTERLTLNQVSGNTIKTNEAVFRPRWGKLQYVTSTGMSLTPEAGYTPPELPAPTVLDQRAAVANLTRNIVIQGADDAAWQTGGFGAHLMFMGVRSNVVIDGVEFRRVGQSGVTGRYPIHWHMLSYEPATGQWLGDATGHVVRNSAIWNSANRCVVVHGTNGVLVKNNICQDIKGHAFFLEDGSERRNVFEGNLALSARAPHPAKQLQLHERSGINLQGPAGFWLTNPDNIVRNNHAGDNTGNGFWLSFPRKPLGLSALVPIEPLYLKLGVFEFNTAHSNNGPGILLDLIPIDAAGNTEHAGYVPLADGMEKHRNVPGNLLRFAFKGITVYKNRNGGYRNRTDSPDYEEWVSADNVRLHMSGAAGDGRIARGLFVGTSLNSATPLPTPPEGFQGGNAAFATYHSTVAMENNTVVNMPLVPGKNSGAFDLSDYYIRPVEKGPVRSYGNRLINSSRGFRKPPPHLDGQPLNKRHWTLSGAIWDTEGSVGPKDNYWVYDVPFLTAGRKCQPVAPAGQNGMSCDGHYMGVTAFENKVPADPQDRYKFADAIQVVRLNDAGAEIGRWEVGEGTSSVMLGTMRHFAAVAGGRYVLRFPDRPLLDRFVMDVENGFRSTDSFMMAVSFDGNHTPKGYTISAATTLRTVPLGPLYAGATPAQQSSMRTFSLAGSYLEVANSNGEKMWHDKTNNLLWLKFRGGLPRFEGQSLVSGSDEDLYRTHSVVIYK